jgi:hypothetical protein
MTESAAPDQKFRQAAFFYLLVTYLYESAVWVMWRQDILPLNWGPATNWMIAGLAVGLSIAYGLLKWKHRKWLARVVCVVHGGRLPTLIAGAFLADETRTLAPGFYVTGMVVVVLNMWMLARAGWDL